MSNYSKTTNFTAKDSLSSGDANKIVKGAEHDTEYDAIETAVNSKLDAYSGATALTSADTADSLSIYDADAGAYKKITAGNFNAGSVAADDISTGDAAVSIATSSGDVTIDAQGNNSDIVLKNNEVEINANTLDVNGKVTIDNTTDASTVVITQNHATTTNATVEIYKAAGAGYPLKLFNDSTTDYVYLAGPAYTYYGEGGEFFHKNGGQTYICRFRDDSDNTNFAVSNSGVYYTGTDTSSPYNRTSSSAANLRVHTNGTLYRSTSSLRFKTDIEDIDDAWADKLLQLKPICYKSTAPGEVENNPADWTYYGFGAEDVVKVDPRYVFLKTHESEFDEDDVETRTELDEPIAEGVQYDRMVPALVNLVKRLTDRVETLEAKVAALEQSS